MGMSLFVELPMAVGNFDEFLELLNFRLRDTYGSDYAQCEGPL